MLLSPGLGNSPEDPGASSKNGIAESLSSKDTLLKSTAKGFISKALKLLVAVSAMLSPADHKKLCGVVWEHYMDSVEPSTLASVSSLLFLARPIRRLTLIQVCFLIMQASEKCPLDLIATIEVDLQR